jgi:hypothetical protein
MVAILKEQVVGLHSSMLRAYEAGKAAGKAEAESELRAKLASVLTLEATPGNFVGTGSSGIASATLSEPTPTPRHSGWTNPRAPRGSVRPAIITALKASSVALTPKQILQKLHEAGHTLVKDETIRSTLHKMATDGVTQQTSDGWTLKGDSPSEFEGFADDPNPREDQWGEPLKEDFMK